MTAMASTQTDSAATTGYEAELGAMAGPRWGESVKPGGDS